MAKHLDEIMMSDKGYIDSFDDIEKLTEKVMNMSARDLMVRGGYDPNTIVDDLLIFNALPEDCSYNVRICDMLNMTNELIHCEYPNDRACAARYAVITAEMLNKASYASADIKLFLSISVKALADFMDKKAGKNKPKCRKKYRRIIGMAKKNALLEVTEKTTIKALTDGIRPYMTKWDPRMYTKAFINYAENCCEIIRKIFIDFMREGYKDMFDFSKLQKSVNENEYACEKYIEEDIDDFGDDDFDEFKEFDFQDFEEIIDIYEELPCDISGDKADETAEYEQLAIEFQPLPYDTDVKAEAGSNNEWDKLIDMISLVSAKTKQAKNKY